MSNENRGDFAFAGLVEGELKQLGAVKRPTPVGFGLAGTAEAPLAARVLSTPHTVDLGLPAIPGAQLFGWTGDPGVYLMTLTDSAARPNGEVCELDAANPGTLLIDARKAKTWVLLGNDQGEWMLSFDGNACAAFAVSRATDAPPPTDLEATAYVRPAIPSPSINDIVGVFSVDPWFKEQRWLVAGVRPLLASPSPLDRFVGVGRLARLASPTPAADALRLTIEDPARAVANVCRGWLSGVVSAEAAAWVEAAALAEADALFDTLDAWLDAPPEDLSGLLPYAHRRDDLESVSFMLASTSHGEELACTLARLDERLEVHQSVLQDVNLDDDRLSAVSWMEPDAWWGLVGG